MDTAFHKLDRLEKLTAKLDARLAQVEDNGSVYWEWIQFLDAERKTLMATVEDLKAKLPALDEAVRQVGDYVQSLSAKVDEASQPHPAVQEMIDHVTGLTDALSRMVPQEVPQSAPDAAPAPSVSDQAPVETETPAP